MISRIFKQSQLKHSIKNNRCDINHVRNMCLDNSSLKTKTLEDHIKKVIKLTGPLPLRHYINECLYNVNHGYYVKGAKIGFKGADFITAPQKSSIFCLLVAHCIRYELQNIYENTNSKVTIVELGAGKGNLINYFLNLLSSDECKMIEQICLVECNASYREEQFNCLKCRPFLESDLKSSEKKESNNSPIKKNFSGFTPQNIKVYWCNTVNELDYFKKSQNPFIIYCNEYFDTIPIQQYVKTIEHDDNSWKAVHVGLDDVQDKLTLTLRSDHILKRYETEILSKYYKSRVWAEFSMEMFAQWRYLLEILDKNNAGSFLNIDYGYTCDQVPKGVTLRAFKNHQIVSVLDDPGNCDITADLDFNAFENIAKLYPKIISLLSFIDLTSHRVITQSEFLFNLKIDMFKEKMKQWFPDNNDTIDNEVNYMTDSAFMGSRFKVHLVGHKSQTLPLCCI